MSFCSSEPNWDQLLVHNTCVYDKKLDEGSKSVWMRENSGASKVVKNLLSNGVLIYQMHSFPIMYHTLGSTVDGLAIRDHFLPKNGLKTAILGDTILDSLTSEGAGTQFFKAIANFSMCFEKFGTLSSK